MIRKSNKENLTIADKIIVSKKLKSKKKIFANGLSANNKSMVGDISKFEREVAILKNKVG